MQYAVWLLVGLIAGAAVGSALTRRKASRGHTSGTADARGSTGEDRDGGERRWGDLAEVLDGLPDGICLYGPDGVSRIMNGALSDLLGVEASKTQLLPPDLQEAVAQAAAGAGTDLEFPVGSPPRRLNVRIDPSGDDGSVLLVARDVTGALQADRIRRDFVANASHELKTPAATIQASAETLQAAIAEDPEAAERFAAQLEREAARLSRIVSDLLDLSRLEGSSDEMTVLDLGPLVEDEVAQARPAAELAGVSLGARTASVPVRGSKRDLALLIRNLVENAVRHTPDGGSVVVELARGAAEASLAVSDTGVGIPSRDLDRIFERFYRVDRARSRDTGGTGLGLSIVRHVAENHGGSVSVTSELGAGSTFTVRLPVAD